MGVKKYDTSSFIKRSQEIHGDKYSYGNCNYKTIKDYLDIECKKHGPFRQRAESYLLGSEGCKDCYNQKVREHNREERKASFLENSYQVHGNKYDYSKVDYINNSTKIMILCPHHGEFYQTPAAHRVGKGCQKCGYIQQNNPAKVSLEQFIEKSTAWHGHFYDYSEVKLQSVREHVKIKCPVHGFFWQPAYNHYYLGHGCRQCSYDKHKGYVHENSKWGPDGYYKGQKAAFLYLIEIGDGEFLKIGLAKRIDFRMATLRRQTGKKIKTLHKLIGPANKLFKFEQHLLKDSKLKRHTPDFKFDGATECFDITQKEVIKEMMDDFQIYQIKDSNVDIRDIFPEFSSIPASVREKALYGIKIYIEEVCLEDITRAAWENDWLLWEEINIEIRDILKDYVLDAAMDVF